MEIARATLKSRTVFDIVSRGGGGRRNRTDVIAELLVFGLGTAIRDRRVIRQKNPTVTNVEPIPAMAESERGIEEAEQAKSKQMTHLNRHRNSPTSQATSQAKYGSGWQKLGYARARH